MQFLTTYSHGLGLLPVSLFYKLEGEIPDTLDSYNSIFNDILLQKVQDIIIYGDIKNNETSLQWLIPRLILNSYMPCHISVMASEVSEYIIPQRYILVLNNSIKAKELFNLLDSLRESDVILVDDKDKDYLTFVRNSCLQRETKVSKIMYNPFSISTVSILLDKMYDVLPCYCSILDK